MLKVAQDVVAFKEIRQMTVDNICMFHDLATSRRQGNPSVVGSLTHVSFLKSVLTLALFLTLDIRGLEYEC